MKPRDLSMHFDITFELRMINCAQVTVILLDVSGCILCRTTLLRGFPHYFTDFTILYHLFCGKKLSLFSLKFIYNQV